MVWFSKFFKKEIVKKTNSQKAVEYLQEFLWEKYSINPQKYDVKLEIHNDDASTITFIHKKTGATLIFTGVYYTNDGRLFFGSNRGSFVY